MNSVAKFLESRGMPERALEVATEPDYRFELAVQLGRLDDALTIAGEAASESKWKQLGELAMSAGKLEVRLTLLSRCSRGHSAGLILVRKRQSGSTSNLICSRLRTRTELKAKLLPSLEPSSIARGSNLRIPV